MKRNVLTLSAVDQHIVVAEVDLVLTRRHLVMRRFDLEAHRLEREHDLAADVLAEIDRREIEVAGRVVRLGGRHAVLRLEEEELRFRARVHHVAGARRRGRSRA